MTAIVCFIVVLVRKKELHLNVETVVSIYIQKTVLKSIIDYETPSVLVFFDYIINFVIFNGFRTNFILDHRYLFFWENVHNGYIKWKLIDRAI